MLSNYFKTAFRTLRRRPGYAAINVVGLAIGIACCLLMGLYVENEWSYDRFHEKSERIYRAYVEEDTGDRQFTNTATPIPLGPELETSFPEVEETVRLNTFGGRVQRGSRQFNERIHLADAPFFEVFDFPLVKGDPASALDRPGSVVLTRETAERYFGDADPVGKTLSIRLGGEVQDFTVTGVAEAPPSASSIQFDVVLPSSHLQDLFDEQTRSHWFQVFGETYALLEEDVSAEALEAKLPSMVKRVLGSEYEEGRLVVGLQPITGIHMNTDLPAGLEPTSDPSYSYILAAIALFVLLIACANFMTLSIGRSAERAKEVGMRKALGARREQLMGQFWGEALLLTSAAAFLGTVLARLALPFFNDLAGQELVLALDGATLGLLAGVVAFVGLVAGSYPALYLSGFDPAAVLKGTLQVKGDKSLFRRGLVVVQFALSIFLVAGTLVMARQLQFLQTKNLGFDKEQVVMMSTTGGFSEGFQTAELLKQELRGAPGVAGVTASAFAFGDPGWATIGYDAEDGAYREFEANFVQPGYIETMGMKMKAGRAFSAPSADTTRGIVVNEALAEEYGWENPLGKRLSDAFDHEIIGVVENFNYASLRSEVGPLVLTTNPNQTLRGGTNVEFASSPDPEIVVRVRGEGVQQALSRIEHTWKQVAPDQPFSFTFLDEAVGRQYRTEERLRRIVTAAAGLSIFIACLGLFGLAALAAVRRRKEIGVRKVLGAKTLGLVGLLAKDFAKLVGVAFLLAAPAVYFTAQRWLTGFAYHMDVGLGTLLAAGAGAMLVALLTVSYHALKAARLNPARALRDE